MFPFLSRVWTGRDERLKDHVRAELRTTFASHYAEEISLVQMLQLGKVAVYNKRERGEKYLINPDKA